MFNFLNKPLKLVILTSLVSILGVSFLFSDQVALSEFGYLNSNTNSTIIDQKEAQDLLNVNVSPGGKSVLKRQGYGLYKTVFSPSAGLHGGFHAYDGTGNDVQIWASSTSVKGIVADGTPNTIVSSMTVGSTIDCADTQGSIYCVDSNRDFYIRTNGTSLTQWYTSPLGIMVESTPDRVVVAGVSGSPNTLFVSKSNEFTTFTTGVNNTDAFNEVIAAPGSKLTHIRWGCQKLLWWKDQSFGYFDFDDQYAAQVKIVSDNIGSFDNTSAIDPGGNVWFRGQDGHTWKYDCSGLEKMTVDITPQIQSSGRRTSNSFTQTSQSDWQLGLSSATGSLSTTISAGDVVASSFTASETSSTQWSLGTASNLAVGTSSITLTINNSGTTINPSFESCTGAGCPGASGACGTADNWTSSDGRVADCRAGSLGPPCADPSPQSGSFMAFGQSSSAGYAFTFETIDLNSTLIQSVSLPNVGGCSWIASTLTPSSSNVGKRVKFRAHYFGTLFGHSYFTTDQSYVWGGPISFYYFTNGGSGGSITFGIDNITLGSSTITSGSFTSQTFNTGMPYSYVFSSATWSVNTSTPSFILQKSADASTWITVTRSTNTNSSVDKQYLRYISSFTVTGNDNALSNITGVQIIARSSGTYFSQWKNAPNLSAWSTFNPTFTNGDGSHAFFVRSSTSPQTVLNSTVAWVSQPVNSQVATSTGTYFQIIDSFTITSATGTTPTLSDFTVNWFDGSAADQAYMLYFDNAIWESVAYGVGISTNNFIFRYDLINDGWGLYYFGANGMLIQGNRLFFGSVTDGNVYQFGSGASDNGTAINAYWKSKDFTGTDPFLQNSLTNIDVFAKKDTGSTLTSTYTVDTSSSTSYSIALSTSNAIVQSRKLLPSGKMGYVWNFKLGDSSTSSQWEVLGIRMGYTTNPYRPTP